MATVPLQLDEDVGKLIDEKIAQYGYANASSYVRDLILRNEAHSDRLRAELQKGLDSGISPYPHEEAIEAGFESARRKCARG